MIGKGSHVFVNGISFWSPRLPGWGTAAAVLAGNSPAPAMAARRPSPSILPPAERRRAPDSVTLAIEVAARACDAAAINPAELPGIFATAHGDLEITDYLCSVLIESPLQTSPTRFHNSVHNAAAGYWCIASGCHAPYTTISVAEYSFGAGLLEALVQLSSEEKPVLYVAYDTGAQGPLATVVTSRGLLGAGLVLSTRRSDSTVAEILWTVGAQGAAQLTAPLSTNADLIGANAMAPCLPFYEALARRTGRVTVAVGPTLALELAIQ